MLDRELFAKTTIEMRHKVREISLTLGADDHMVVVTDEGEGVDLDDLASPLFYVIDRLCDTTSDEAIDSLSWLHE